MYRRLVFSVVFVTLFWGIQGGKLKLPSYITPCKQSDPNVNDCVIQEGNRVIPSIVHGDKKYKIPNLMPFKLDSVVVRPSEQLKLELMNCEILGLENAKIEANDVDFEKRTWKISIRIPNTQLFGDYKISGQILILPITGSGKSNITLVDTVFKYDMKFDLKDEDGAQHAILLDRSTKYIPKRVYYKFENLFNGNKLLSNEMTKFLNDNWKDVNEEIGGAAEEIISTVASSIIKQFFKIVPFDELFTP